ncbi:MAG: heme-binding domain-containing protein [Bryobacterales bacterium]|nr:heme-binding domain-containing protein [Bryobacterales bacterium]MBV9399473.1 heme-binding domain-containing protein [Bryobacterales bacterium]
MMRPSRKVIISTFTVILLILLSSFVHPFGPVKHQNPARPLLSTSSINPEAKAVILRACRNCHSEKTEWPWYSFVAPVSWLLESDVSRARGHMNFSHWEEYTTDQRFALLNQILAVVSARAMPPARYRLLHPEASLSDTDADRIIRWARAEMPPRRRRKPAER